MPVINKIIFLDIDGVLNSDDDFDESKYIPGLSVDEFYKQMISEKLVKRLNTLIEATRAFIVISSTWRKLFSPAEIIDILEAKGFKYPQQIIGETPILRAIRGDEIQSYLSKQKELVKFVILDDDSDMGHLIGNLIQTDTALGLQDKDVEKAIEILKG